VVFAMPEDRTERVFDGMTMWGRYRRPRGRCCCHQMASEISVSGYRRDTAGQPACRKLALVRCGIRARGWAE
jgi:hypothetical protein